jgi:SAM-dependent methyltransferase
MMLKNGSPEREKLIKQWARKILEKLAQVLPGKPVEAELRRAVEPLLDQFCQEAGVNPLVHAEYTLATGRADAIFNRLVIEFKAPGVLKKSLDKATQSAVSQVRGYVQDLGKKHRHEVSRLAGVVFDGRFLIFGRFAHQKWVEEPPAEVNQHSLEKFLTWLAGLSSGIALTAEKLNQDFAIEQLRTQNILRALFQALNQTLSGPESIVTKLFDQWRLFFSESIDYTEAFGGRKLEPLKKWVRKAGLEVKTPGEAERFFFALHTYFALLLKFLAWLALSRHLAVRLGAPVFGELVTADGDTLRRRLHEMEDGGIFVKYGLKNLLEGDFFRWYLHGWNEQVEDAIRELLKRLDEYDPTTLSVVPEETRDLFKKLYHYLLPRKIRHNLGEYYTPDWLAQRLLNQVDNEFFTYDPRRSESSFRRKLLNLRFLDPACGSGTFLVLAIGRMMEVGQALLVNEADLLQAILENVVGFDLNPLAVLTARVNYLLAVADLLEYRRGDITIPIYLADSVRTPATGKDLWSAGAYEFPTAIGKFMVPVTLCVKGRFDKFCEMLEDSIKAGLTTEIFLRRVEKELGLKEEEWGQDDIEKLSELYSTFEDYHRQGMNGMWARLLKNNYAPITSRKFHHIIGNPPWVNWEHLPDGYRDDLKPIWIKYGLFPHGGMDTILGKGKKDISMIMTYVVMDKLLLSNGRLGFVITQSVLKTSGAGQGFRRFTIPQGAGNTAIPLRATYVDDMVRLNPFEGASNRTAIIILEKGRPTRYPVPYTIWRKEKRGRFTYDNTLAEVTSATRRMEYLAEPVSEHDSTSAWLTARRILLKTIRKVLGKSDYKAFEGVNSGGANGVYWLDIVMKRPDGLLVVRNFIKGSRVEVQEVTETVEPDLIYPLLRGRDVKKWKAQPAANILMVQDPVKRRGYDENEFQGNFPLTYGYLKQFEKVLRERAAFKRYFTRKEKKNKVIDTGPFYSMFNVGQYTFSPYKVVWREQAAHMTACVIGKIGEKVIIPDHKLMVIECNGLEESHFICALLNSNIVRLAIIGYAVEIQMNPHILENIRIPKFDQSDPLHQRLYKLSVEAHDAAKNDDLKRLQKAESHINDLAAQLWGISGKEIIEIEKSLKELAGFEDEEIESDS